MAINSKKLMQRMNARKITYSHSSGLVYDGDQHNGAWIIIGAGTDLKGLDLSGMGNGDEVTLLCPAAGITVGAGDICDSPTLDTATKLVGLNSIRCVDGVRYLGQYTAEMPGLTGSKASLSTLAEIVGDYDLKSLSDVYTELTGVHTSLSAISARVLEVETDLGNLNLSNLSNVATQLETLNAFIENPYVPSSVPHEANLYASAILGNSNYMKVKALSAGADWNNFSIWENFLSSASGAELGVTLSFDDRRIYIDYATVSGTPASITSCVTVSASALAALMRAAISEYFSVSIKGACSRFCFKGISGGTIPCKGTFDGGANNGTVAEKGQIVVDAASMLLFVCVSKTDGSELDMSKWRVASLTEV